MSHLPKPPGPAAPGPLLQRTNSLDMAEDKENAAGGLKRTSAIAGKPPAAKRPAVVHTTGAADAQTIQAASAPSGGEELAWEDMVAAEKGALTVEGLLASRVAVKNKYDYKAKAEQQSSLIRQLRACARHLAAREGALAGAHAALEAALDREATARKDDAAAAVAKAEEMSKTAGRMRSAGRDLEVRLKAAAEREAALIKAATDRDDALHAATEAAKAGAAERARLSSESSAASQLAAKVAGEADGLRAQLAGQSALTAQLTDHAAALSARNGDLQKEASAAAEAARRVQGEYASVVEALAAARGAKAAGEAQLADVDRARAMAVAEAVGLTAALAAATQSAAVDRAESARAAATLTGQLEAAMAAGAQTAADKKAALEEGTSLRAALTRAGEAHDAERTALGRDVAALRGAASSLEGTLAAERAAAAATERARAAAVEEAGSLRATLARATADHATTAGALAAEIASLKGALAESDGALGAARTAGTALEIARASAVDDAARLQAMLASATSTHETERTSLVRRVAELTTLGDDLGAKLAAARSMAAAHEADAADARSRAAAERTDAARAAVMGETDRAALAREVVTQRAALAAGDVALSAAHTLVRELDHNKKAAETTVAEQMTRLSEQAGHLAAAVEGRMHAELAATAAEAHAATLAPRLAMATQEMTRCQEVISGLTAQLAAAVALGESATRSRDAAAAEAASTSADNVRLRAELQAAQMRIAAADVDVERFLEGTGRSTAEMAALSTTASTLQASCATQLQVIAGLQRDGAVTVSRAECAEQLAAAQAAECLRLQGQLAAAATAFALSERRCAEGEHLRRRLHNTILELKGNVRVFCRVRPPSDAEKAGENTGEGLAVSFPETTELAGRGIELVSGSKYSFSFDKVFAPAAPQAEVFEEIAQLVQSALDGYKVAIFAYGQTGSGKTHTMVGGTGDAAGMIPRSLTQIFASAAALAERGWEFRLTASMLEIYNEEYKDLLGAKGEAKLEVRHDTAGNTTVVDLVTVDVTSPTHVESLLAKAHAARSVGRTNSNEHSSRSHMVFTLRIDGRNTATGQVVRGVLNLIDLAGSERLAKSGATGDRLKETQAINKSLSALGDVIAALAEKKSHIPYRNSKLTWLLQPSLGGDAKTLFFVNVSPARDSAPESLCSLRFAAKVNSCEVGTARRNVAIKD